MLHRPADGCARRSLTQSRPVNRRITNAVTKPAHDKGQRCLSLFAFIVGGIHYSHQLAPPLLKATAVEQAGRRPRCPFLGWPSSHVIPGARMQMIKRGETVCPLDIQWQQPISAPPWPSTHAPGARMKMTTRGKMADGHSPVALHSLA